MRIRLTRARECVERTFFYRTAHFEVMMSITEPSDTRHHPSRWPCVETSHRLTNCKVHGAQICTLPNRVTLGSKIKIRP